jgi:hypothetical protein
MQSVREQPPTATFTCSDDASRTEECQVDMDAVLTIANRYLSGRDCLITGHPGLGGGRVENTATQFQQNQGH